jgi:1-acyl-sn-glycerol-3-phosphate acyltransferase
MGINRIDKKSYIYLLLKPFVAFWHNRVFYRRIVILNREQIPQNAHLIFTGNHQNALMDALVFLFGVKGRLVFMARSDIYKKPLIAAILYFFRMLPIFRMKDGYSEVKKNDKVFQKTIDVIKSKIGIVIMAEGNHGSERRLRPLKKGFARIAFQTEEANDFQLNMQIVPVGMDYSDYYNFRTELLINFGKPIQVSDFIESYKESPAIAINQIKERLAESLIPLMVHIKSVNHYDLYNELREIYKFEMAKEMGFPSVNQPFKLQADQELIRRLEKFEEEYPEQMSGFQNTVLRFRDNLSAQKLDYEVVTKPAVSKFKLLTKWALLFVASPVFAIGWLLNYFPFGFSIWVGNKMSDRQFHSSFKFAVSLFLYPIWHLLGSIFVWMLLGEWIFALGFFVAMPILGILARWYWVAYTDFRKQCRWFRLETQLSTDYQTLKTDQEQIFSQMKTVIS